MHPWGIQMNLMGCILHFAWAWRDWRNYLGNGRLGGRRRLVIRNAWLLFVCDMDMDSGSRSITNHYSSLDCRRWACAPRLIRNDIKAAKRKAQATVERVWVEWCTRR